MILNIPKNFNDVVQVPSPNIKVDVALINCTIIKVNHILCPNKRKYQLI